MPKVAWLLLLVVAIPGCYGPGIMGWGTNGTDFEVEREQGYVEVTAVGRGPMRAVSPGQSPEYVDDPPQWADFALQFEEPGMRARFNASADASSAQIPAGEPWPLTQVASGQVRVGDRIYFCHDEADSPPYRFAAIMGGGPATYNLWFEAVRHC